MKTILVTGAGSGIGLGAVTLLAAQGHSVIAVAEFEEQKKNIPEGIAVVVGDLTQSEFRQKLVQEYGTIDVLVCNAGVGESGPLIEQPEERIRKVFEVNVMATILLAQFFGQRMAKRGNGRLVFVTSMAGIVTVPNLGAYSATKHALEAMAAALRQELRPFGVTVAAVQPGLIFTGFNEHMAASKFEWLASDSLYGASFAAWRAHDATLPERSYNVDLAAKTVAQVALSSSRTYYHPTPRIYAFVRVLLNILPVRLLDGALRKAGM